MFIVLAGCSHGSRFGYPNQILVWTIFPMRYDVETEQGTPQQRLEYAPRGFDEEEEDEEEDEEEEEEGPETEELEEEDEEELWEDM